MNTDPIADYLTRIRNAQMAGHKVVEIPASNMKKEMTRILFDKGYILNFKFDDAGHQGTIKIALRYDGKTKRPAITELQRVSTPGLRQYASSGDLPRIERPRRVHRFYFQGVDDRQGMPQDEHRWRSHLHRLLIRKE